jgi:hypothetical protein
MLSNQPIVKVFANNTAVLLLLDTGAEATVLTPAAAQRIGAQHARVEWGRQMHGLTGDIPADGLELRNLTIGGIEVPRRRVRVGPIEIVNALSGPLDGVLGADILRSFDIDLDLTGAPYDPLPRAKLRGCLAGLDPTLRSDRGGSVSEQPLILFGAARRPQDQRPVR